jgi:hypothetical protein
MNFDAALFAVLVICLGPYFHQLLSFMKCGSCLGENSKYR